VGVQENKIAIIRNVQSTGSSPDTHTERSRGRTRQQDSYYTQRTINRLLA
jgi:hypothetical protein